MGCGEGAWRNLEVGSEPRTRGGSARWKRTRVPVRRLLLSLKPVEKARRSTLIHGARGGSKDTMVSWVDRGLRGCVRLEERALRCLPSERSRPKGSFPGWRGERLMRGSGRAWSSPKVVPEGAIQYVRLRGCGSTQWGVEETALRAVAISDGWKSVPLHELRVRFWGRSLTGRCG